MTAMKKEAPASLAPPAFSLKSYLAQNWIIGILLLMIVIFSLIKPNFVSWGNWFNITDTAVAICLLAALQTVLIIAGAIDLSQAAVMGFSSVSGAYVMTHYFGGAATSQGLLATLVGFAVALIIGLLVGLINGVIIAKSRLNPFIVTLGSFQACFGLANLLSNGQEMTDLPPEVGAFGNFYIGSIVSMPVLIAIAIIAIASLILNNTRFGKFTYVLGDSREAAVRAGIPVDRHVISLYVLSSCISAVAGILVMARLSDASPAAGQDLLLNSIAAAVIGGASLAGGRGSVARAVVGGLIISTLLIGLVIVNVQPFWQQVAVGVVLIVAVFVDERGIPLKKILQMRSRS